MGVVVPPSVRPALHVLQPCPAHHHHPHLELGGGSSEIPEFALTLLGTNCTATVQCDSLHLQWRMKSFEYARPSLEQLNNLTPGCSRRTGVATLVHTTDSSSLQQLSNSTVLLHFLLQLKSCLTNKEKKSPI